MSADPLRSTLFTSETPIGAQASLEKRVWVDYKDLQLLMDTVVRPSIDLSTLNQLIDPQTRREVSAAIKKETVYLPVYELCEKVFWRMVFKVNLHHVYFGDTTADPKVTEKPITEKPYYLTSPQEYTGKLKRGKRDPFYSREKVDFDKVLQLMNGFKQGIYNGDPRPAKKELFREYHFERTAPIGIRAELLTAIENDMAVVQFKCDGIR